MGQANEFARTHPLMVGKMDEFPASLLAQFNNGKCFLIFFPSVPKYQTPLSSDTGLYRLLCSGSAVPHVFWGGG